MDCHPLAGQVGELPGHVFAGDGELEVLGLHAAAGTALGPVTGQDHFAFIGLEDISGLGEGVEFTGLRAVAEYIIEAEIEEYRSGDEEDQDDPAQDAFSSCHNSDLR